MYQNITYWHVRMKTCLKTYESIYVSEIFINTEPIFFILITLLHNFLTLKKIDFYLPKWEQAYLLCKTCKQLLSFLLDVPLSIHGAHRIHEYLQHLNINVLFFKVQNPVVCHYYLRKIMKETGWTIQSLKHARCNKLINKRLLLIMLLIHGEMQNSMHKL